MKKNIKIIYCKFFLMAILSFSVSCTTMNVKNKKNETKKTDPLEKINRDIFLFNQEIDRRALKPVAKIYYTSIAEPIRGGVTNFFQNILDIYNAGNNFLQGKPVDCVNDISRFVVNSTFGILGIFDIASNIGLEKHHEDFGQTLAVWGIPSGPYLMLPFLGPTTIRDGISSGIAIYSNSIFNSHKLSVTKKLQLTGLKVVNFRANLLDTEQLLDQVSFEDRYSFIRDSYLQYRYNKIYDGYDNRIQNEDNLEHE